VEDIRWAVATVIGVLVVVVGWLFRLLSGKANARTTDKRFDDMLAEIRQQRNDLKSHEAEDRAMHKDVLAEIRETNRHLSITNSTLSNLVGRFDATNGHH
jgi:uncharacterized membrane-anchored protein YhcB (DUF1043 family)